MKNIIFILLFIWPVILRDQDNMDSTFVNFSLDVLDIMYNEDFNSAYSLLDNKLVDYPDDPRYLFLLSTVKFWQITILYGLEGATYLEEKKDSFFYSFNRTMDKIIKYAEEREKHDKQVDGEMDFILGLSYGLKGIFDLEFNGIFSAISNGEKAVQYMEETLKIDSSLTDSYFGLGLYNYNADNTNFFIRLILPLFFRSADEELGLEYLELSKNFGKLSKYHATFTLAQIYYNKGDIERSISYLKELNEKFKNSSVFATLLTQHYYKLGKYEKSIEISNNFVKQIDDVIVPNRNLTGVIYITAAKSYEKLGDYRNAVYYMKKYVENIYPKSYFKNALEFIEYYEKQMLNDERKD